MNINLENVLTEINDGILRENLTNNGRLRIRGVKKLTARLSEFGKDIAYVTSSEELDGYNERLKNLLVRAIAAGDVILFVCGADNEDLSWLSADPTESSGNVILIDSSYTSDDLLNLISDLLIDNHHFIEKPAALFNTIIKGRGVPYIVEIAGELLENPVLIGDSNHRLIGSSIFPDLDDEPWMEFRNTGFCTFDYVQKYRFEDFIEKSVRTKKAIIGDISENFKYRRIFCPVVVSGRVVGHLAVLEYNRKLTDEDLEITEFICEIIANEMAGDNSHTDTKNLLTNQLLVDLLQGNIQDEAVLERRLAKMKWNLPEKKYLIAIEIHNFSEGFALVPNFRESLKEKLCFIETVHYQGKLLMLVGCDEDREFLPDDFGEFANYLREKQLKGGISHFFDNTLDLKQAYHQAQSAIELGMKVTPDEVLFAYEDQAIYDLLEKVGENQELTNFCHPALLKLAGYDQEHQTEYLNNLYVYIINMGNLVASAEALFIHRNTLSYRLKKIEEIINYDIHNRDHFINLFVSYKIMEYTKLI